MVHRLEGSWASVWSLNAAMENAAVAFRQNMRALIKLFLNILIIYLKIKQCSFKLFIFFKFFE